jgi:hypothetical protein
VLTVSGRHTGVPVDYLDVGVDAGADDEQRPWTLRVQVEVEPIKPGWRCILDRREGLSELVQESFVSA